MSSGSSHRQILRSSSIIGGASVVNILISLLRTKVAAVLLGPAGIGLIGLFQSLIATASAMAALGFGTVGTRQIAEAAGRKDAAGVAAARRALFWGTAILAVIGFALVWLLRETLATRLLGDASRATDVGWLALGVGLTVAAGSQGALLTGLRRIGDIARVSVWSSVLATVIGVSALWLWGPQGLLVFVLATPLGSFLIGHLYVARVPKVQAPSTPMPQLAAQWKELVRIGIPFMVTGVIVAAGQLAVRGIVQTQLGPSALGQFQAAWVVSVTYMGFVLGAMGADYYPRLTAAIEDRQKVNELVNQQTEVALLLASPVLLILLALAPWAIEILYSSSFDRASSLLRWQIVGDVLKIASWPLGFVLLAAGAGRTFMLTEALAVGVFTGAVWIMLPVIGLAATSFAFVTMYLFYLPVVYWLARRRTDFRWDRQVFFHAIVLFLFASLVSLAITLTEWLGVALACLGAALFGCYGFVRLDRLTGLPGQLSRVAVKIRTFLSIR